MGFLLSKQQVAAACLCIFFLLPVLASSYSELLPPCPDSDQLASSGNFTHSITLDKSLYTIATQSGILDDLTRRDVVDRSVADADAQGMMYINMPGISATMTSYASIDAGKTYCLQEASFSVSFTMSLYPPSWNETTTTGQNNSSTSSRGVAFLVVPDYYSPPPFANDTLAKLLGLGEGGSLRLSNATSWTGSTPGGGSVSGELGWLPDHALFSLADLRLNRHLHLVVHITTIRRPATAAAAHAAAEIEYTVWIEYDHRRGRLQVYVGADKSKVDRPVYPVAVKNNVSYRDIDRMPNFGLFSSLGQLLQVHTWKIEAAELPGIINYKPNEQTEPNQTLLAILVSAAALVSAMAFAAACNFLSHQRRRWKKELEKLAKTMQRLPGVPTQVDFADIVKATDNFHETMRLGRGGFSSVYRCRINIPASSGSSAAASSTAGATREVAVKKFTRGVHEERYEDFLSEVSIINRLRHKNVVPLVGWSYHKGEPLLIYEYMKNGSLDQHLFRRGSNGEQQHQQEETSLRHWHTRYSVVRDVATGLHYVHHEHEPMVLHRDIKASNIMLDSSFCARLGDFGIACTVAADRSSVTGMAGTWGYIAPEYAMSRRATRQTDIYAFGVLILEVVTGRKNMDVPTDDDDGHISEWVWRLHGEGKLLEAVDREQQRLVDVDDDEAERLLLLGLACTNPNPSNRPSMAEAVQVITRLAPPPGVPPERPAFVWPPAEWRSLDSTSYYSTAREVSYIGGSSSASTDVEMQQMIRLQEEQPLTHSRTFVIDSPVP